MTAMSSSLSMTLRFRRVSRGPMRTSMVLLGSFFERLLLEDYQLSIMNSLLWKIIIYCYYY